MLSLAIVTILFTRILGNDPFRPQYHLLPPKNWLNDPNGPVYYNGFYHMFFQYNPIAPLEQEIHWGHCYSKDMIHWIHLPIALTPDRPYDINGVLTGSTTIVNGTPIIMYAGIDENNEQVICQAHPANISDPTLTEWIKSPLNPLITHPFGRDPSTAFQDNQGNYYLIYGYGTEELGGQAVLFTSRDFLHWMYLHPIHGNHYDVFWECPDIFNISDRIVMKASLLTHDFWAVGRFDFVTKTFSPLAGDLGEYTQLIDPGKFYASKSFYDPLTNQQILVGWIDEDDNQGILRGWQGLHSLPRTIFLSEDGLQLRSRPIDAVKSLRNDTTHRIQHNLVLSPGMTYIPISDTNGNQLEIKISWQFPSNQDLDFGLHVLSTPDGRQRTSIGILTRTNITWMEHWDLVGYDYLSASNIVDPISCRTICDQETKCRAWTFVSNRPMNDNCFLKTGLPRLDYDPSCISGVKDTQTDTKQLVWIYMNRSLSQYNIAASRDPIAATLWMQSTRISNNVQWFLELDIFIDHSVIEVFEPKGGRIAMTTRVYPEEPTAQYLVVYLNTEQAMNQTVIVNSINTWSLESIWN